jgi:hypothetical protein
VVENALVKIPTPIAPIAIRISRTVRPLKSMVRGRKHAPMIDSNPKRKAEELKTIEEDPTPRSLM